jgi:G:T-mismatch repair DNA endonuclease (very short patch repair protein)
LAHLWQRKFERNVARRLEYLAALDVGGFVVVEAWECEVKADLAGVVARFVAVLEAERA